MNKNRILLAAQCGIAALAFAATADAASVNVVTNGDFEAGNTGFSSDFTFEGGGAAAYSIESDPQDQNVNFASFGDHTTGSGLMMVVNGGVSAGGTVWSQTTSVVSNSTYSFSLWIASAFSASPATLDMTINGAVLGQAIATGTTGVWTNFSFDWASGSATSAVLGLVEASGASFGNDYALDDIALTGEASTVIPLPATGLVLISGLAGIAALRKRRAA